MSTAASLFPATAVEIEDVQVTPIQVPYVFPDVFPGVTSFPVVASLPVVTDPSVFPRPLQEPSAENPFTHPKPKVLTGPRSWVRVIKARRKLVVVDSDLAELYETTIDVVNKLVMRNACCFPGRACFRLSNAEWHHLKDISPLGDVDRGNWLCAPLAFTLDGAWAISEMLDTFHALRHTCGTLLARNGVHPKVAQVLMRHSTITLTMGVYTHTSQESRAAAVAKLPVIKATEMEEKGEGEATA